MKSVESTDIYGNKYLVDVEELQWRPSAYGVVIKDDSIVLTKQQGTFHLPGGGVERGETYEEAVMREIREETGLEVKNPELITVTTTFFTYYDEALKKHIHNQSILLFYACELVGGELSMDGFEESEKKIGGMPEWVPIAELKTLKSASTFDWQNLVLQYVKKFGKG